MTLGDADFRKSPVKMFSRMLPETTSLPVTLSHGRSAVPNESDHKKNQKDNEQNPCNLGRGTGDAAESQNAGNQSDDKKSNAPT